MRTAFASKMSYFILTFIFLIIIASFIFTGFDKFTVGTTRHAAMVNDIPVTAKEFQAALSRQVELFNQFMGTTLTPKQMEEFKIKEEVLKRLIEQKMVLSLADKASIAVSLDEVKKEIRSIPVFNTNDQFNVSLYRNALQANGYTPSEFEDLVAHDIKQRKVEEIFTSTMVAPAYAADVARFKSNSVTVHGVKIPRQQLSPLISVSEKEIQDFISNPANQAQLEQLYTDNASEYNRAAEVKARHILITGEDQKALEKARTVRNKVTAKNFASIAEKETEDPTGKGTGGDLGWFSAGRMVPEFEQAAFGMSKGEISQPIKTEFGYHIIMVEDKRAAETRTLEQVKPELARLALQQTKAQDLDQLMKAEEARLTEALKANNLNTVEATSQKVNGQAFKSTKVNQFEQSLSGTNLSTKEVEQLFNAPAGSVVNLGNPGTIFLVRVVSRDTAGSPGAEQVKTERNTLNQNLSRRTRTEFLRSMQNEAKAVINPAFM